MKILFKKIQLPKLAQKIILYIFLFLLGIFLTYTLIIPCLLFNSNNCLDCVLEWIELFGIPIFIGSIIY
ncbi:MAG: hypothetical protein V1891_01545, partial [bacterium]